MQQNTAVGGLALLILIREVQISNFHQKKGYRYRVFLDFLPPQTLSSNSTSLRNHYSITRRQQIIWVCKSVFKRSNNKIHILTIRGELFFCMWTGFTSLPRSKPRTGRHEAHSRVPGPHTTNSSSILCVTFHSQGLTLMNTTLFYWQLEEERFSESWNT
jgi:hypothetical protein